MSEGFECRQMGYIFLSDYAIDKKTTFSVTCVPQPVYSHRVAYSVCMENVIQQFIHCVHPQIRHLAASMRSVHFPGSNVFMWALEMSSTQSLVPSRLFINIRCLYHWPSHKVRFVHFLGNWRPCVPNISQDNE